MSERIDSMTDGGADLPARSDARPSLSRRNALKVAGAALAGVSSALGSGVQAQTALPIGRLDYVYFLLNFAYFQASLYSGAYRGEFLPASLLGLPAGTPTERVFGGPTPFTDPILRDFVGELLETELAQLNSLRDLADSLDQPFEPTSIVAPKMFLNTTATREDGFSLTFSSLVDPSYANFNLYGIEENFLVAISHFKDIVVTAYQGICALSANDPLFSSFMGIQAYSAAILRDMIYERAKQPGSRLFTISNRLAARRSELVPEISFTDQSVEAVSTTSGLVSNIVPTDERGRAKQRTPLQILLLMQGRPRPFIEPLFLRTMLGRINLPFYGITTYGQI